MDTATRARELALLGIEVRATQSQNTGNTGGSGSQTAHAPAGQPTGGQFTANPTGGGSTGYKSILPPDSGYKSGGSGKKKTTTAAAPSGVPQAPATPRTMKLGDSGEDVRYAQYGMSLLGFKVNQSGEYDQATVDAVKQMQARLGVAKPNGHLSASQLRKIQDAVRLSPCIGAGQRDLEAEAQWEARFAEPEPDLDEDGLAEAVTDALDEFVARSFFGDWEERAHDVSKELRIPGGAGGGRWTKNPVTNAILKALKEAKGPDSFTLDGKPIEREPLRKAAVARGIKLPRGASRDDIVKALLDDVGGKPEGKPDAPSAPSPRADAKAKYAAVAQSRPYASAAAAVAELTGKKQSNAVIAEHVRAIAHPDSPDMAEIGGPKAAPSDLLASHAEKFPAGSDARQMLTVYADRLKRGAMSPSKAASEMRNPGPQGWDLTPDQERQIRGVADELIGGGKSASASTAAHDLEQVAAAYAAGNPTLGKRRMTAALKKQGITQGPAGVVPFDPAAHEHLGNVPAPGTPVSVVRPGMSLHRGEGDHVQLSKAVVMSAPGNAPAKAAKAAPADFTGDYANRRAALSNVSGEPTVTKLEGGISSKAEVLTYPDGTKVVRKDYSNNRTPTATDKVPANAEELAAPVLDAFGVPAPAVRRVNDSTIEMQFVDGQQGGKTGALSAPQAVVDSPAGRRLGLADAVMGHHDRAGGNWMRVGDGIVPIDNGNAFMHSELAAAGNPFTRYLMTSTGWKRDLPVDRQELADVRQRLVALKPEFTRVMGDRFGNANHKAMLDRLDAISARATGAKAAPSNPAEILSSLPADLTPAQRRARLRSKGVSKAEIDALVPLAPRKAAAKPTRVGGVETAGATSVAALPHTPGPVDHHAAAKASNPHFGSTADGAVYRDAGRAGEKWTPDMGPLPSGAYEENCTNVVQAFEMRMRGYDVQAAPLDVLDKYGYAAGRTFAEIDQLIEDSWRLKTGKPHGRSFKAQKWRSFDEIDSEIGQWPEGGRGTIFVGKHIFSVVKVDGRPQYVEAQFGTKGQDVTTAYRRRFGGEAGGAKLIRLDDLVPADGILGSVGS